MCRQTRAKPWPMSCSFLLVTVLCPAAGSESSARCFTSDERKLLGSTAVDSCPALENQNVNREPASKGARTLLQSGNRKLPPVVPVVGSSDMVASVTGFVAAASERDPDKLGWKRDAFVAVALIGTVLIALGLKNVVDRYEEEAGPSAMPWYFNSRLLALVGGTCVLFWLILGIVAFTQVIRFTEGDGHLTCAEALYLCVQILTTVGYGDFTPTYPEGQVFMSGFVLIGVSLVAMLVSEMLNQFLSLQSIRVEGNSLSKSGSKNPLAAGGARNADASGPANAGDTGNAADGANGGDADEEEGAEEENEGSRFGPFLFSIPPYLASVVVGTLFFNLYPGEGKTIWQGLYMSTVTLTTVGFGAFHPVTQGGYLFASIWMLIGVGATGNMIIALGDCLLRYRKELKADHMGKKFLDSMDKDGSGSVDKLEFLCFELARKGLCDETEIQKVLKKFAKLDRDGSGQLDISDLVKPKKPSRSD